MSNHPNAETPLSKTLALACELMTQASVTPDDADCQKIMIQRLSTAGFEIKKLRFGEVDNFWAVHNSSDHPEENEILAFAGHTDVVPTGNELDWDSPPFEPKVDNGMLFGRGAADMKGSLAAMIVAAEQFVKAHPHHPHRLAFLITSDEEGIAIDGTVKVIEYLEQKNEKIRWCVVGEPSSTNKTGDTIKNGRRGSLGAKVTIEGIQGHVAYPHLADNPVHRFGPALVELNETVWDHGNEFFPPTSFQISNIQAGTGATNVIPGTMEIICNFRFSTELTEDSLRQRFNQVLDKHKLNYKIDWRLSGQPFLTEPGELVDAAVKAIHSVTGMNSELSTAGGTSDGRFIAPTGAQVIELGPVNKTIHQVNEQVNANELDQLTEIYQRIMEQLLSNN